MEKKEFVKTLNELLYGEKGVMFDLHDDGRVDEKNAEKVNAEMNKIKNIEFILDDASHGLYKVARKTYIDTLLVDPPRSGLDNKMIEAITHILPNKIVYVSCNPATLAKNLNILKKYYKIRTIIPFDFFPNTPLVESITVLELI